MRILIVMLFAAVNLSAQSAGSLHKALSAEAKKLEGWTNERTIVSAVAAQNARRVSVAEIERIDKEWQSGSVLQDVIKSDCADRLRELMRQRDVYVEAFVADDQGALVCASGPTSDYWQGDEAKWQRAFDEGRGAVFIDRPRFDESAKATMGSISIPIRDDGRVIGVLTVGVVPK